MKKTAKSILFRANLKGYGIVNYDGPDQKSTYCALMKTNDNKAYNNVTYAKRQWVKNEDGTHSYKIMISSDCLKHEIYKKHVPFQSPNIMHHASLLLNYMASPEMLLRGYMFATSDSKSIFKRSSAISLFDAIQTNNAVSTIETFARSGEKIHDDNKSDTSLFKKETVGDITYRTRGIIDLMQLQFLSADETFDRCGINSDDFEGYVDLLSKRLNGLDCKLGYYQIKNSVVDIPEYGVLFSNENVVELTKIFFKELLSFRINRSRSYAETIDLEYKVVYDPLYDKMEDDNGWTKLSADDIDSLTFEMNDYYVPVDFDKAVALRNEMDDKMKEIKEKNRIAKEAKKKKAVKDNSIEDTATEISSEENEIS